MQINEVYSVTATAEPDVFMISCNITDDVPATYDCVYCSRPDDTFGLGPDFRQWLVDNPDIPIEPYVPPTLEQIRAGALPLPRIEFRTRAGLAGLTTAKINEYLAAIADPAEQMAMQIYWEDSQSFARLARFVVDAGAYAGLTEAQLDDVFHIGA